MEHVFGKKHRFRIFLRKVNSYIYRKLTSGGKPDLSKAKSVVCYPAFEDQEYLSSVLNKFAWAFPEESGVKVYFACNDKLSVPSLSFNLEKYQHNYINNSKCFIWLNETELRETIQIAGQVAVVDASRKYDVCLLPHLKKCYVIDPDFYYMLEGNYWKFAYYEFLTEKERELFKTISSRNFTEFARNRTHKRKAYLFLTGPSYSSYPNYKYDTDSIKIVCNTIVKDTEFLDYIGGPDIITFADSVFHFSSTKYAHIFRSLVLEAVRNYGSYLAVPSSTVPLLLAHYPSLKDRIIGFRRSENICFPNASNISVKPAKSIISFLMLPLASAFADQIFILGADGRTNKENYYWKHNTKVQLDELMESVYLSHPSFFRDSDYADYYKQHCDYLEAMILKGEKEGKQYFSLSPSYIPALSSRQYRK